MSDERDLAEAIQRELNSEHVTDAALVLWDDMSHCPLRMRMQALLSILCSQAIDTVLARRQSEAARTGRPWETVPYGALRERIARAIYDADRVVGVRVWADAPAATREDCYVCAEAALSAMTEPTEAARAGQWGTQLEARCARMQDALERLANWSEAYPLDIFPEPDLAKVRELLAVGGITLDAVSAHCMRHALDGVGKMAREAARSGPWDADPSGRKGNDRRQGETPCTGPWDGGHHFQEEDGYPGSLLPPKRDTP